MTESVDHQTHLQQLVQQEQIEKLEELNETCNQKMSDFKNLEKKLNNSQDYYLQQISSMDLRKEKLLVLKWRLVTQLSNFH